ncbi:MAG: RNA-binding transcriptional accessory protein [Deltaproteobacteria bacterium]|nr:RNA-binding transcriptional accessory protein [Deltaproteobacteria bacterium]
MSDAHVTQIAGELGLAAGRVQAAADLLAEGGTVPFIARYRKEATGSLDEVAITAIRDRLARLAELDKRRAAILGSLEERGLLTDELRARVLAAPTLAVLEDVYLPFRPKRRTRAMLARERGLEPLAERLWAQDPVTDPPAEAVAFVDPERGVPDAAAALAGARDILAERVHEDADGRAELRSLYRERAVIRSRVVKGREQEGAKYRDYFDASEPAAKAPSHRILALRRGEAEGFLTLELAPPPEEALARLEARFVRGTRPAAEQVRTAVRDSYKRLLGPALETELRQATKQRADAEAIRVFAANLRRLLLAPPLGRRRVLAVDPGFRTGAKLVSLDAQGALLGHDVIFPTHGERRAAEAAATVRALCERHRIEVLAVGNGTAGRETEAFLRGLELPGAPAIVMVNESGASIYSASEVAREEFPDHDVTVRGAVSIGRRLQDPLAELVKLDPKSIGVGQYQHDVDQGDLRRMLDDVVVSCVNGVGVEVNTASRELLAYVSGLGPQLAANVVAWRAEHGPFRSRRQLREVPRLGPKAFEQAAGFLRVHDGEHPLDASAVHPERYPLVETIARDLGCTVGELLRDETLRGRIDPRRYVADGVGLPTLHDILAELARPGRDPRERFEPLRFDDGVRELTDLRPGMKLAGVVTNVAAFGAFVDVGVHQDGLVHVSRLADRFVRDPAEVVHVGQHVRVTVVEVDLERRRIGLSMRAEETAPREPRPESRPPPPKTRMAELLQDWHAKRGR